jgi:hypothetical protein
MLRLFSAIAPAFAAAVIFLGVSAGPAFAQNEFCNNEMTPLMKDRQAISARLNAIVKNPKKANAREQFCSNMSALIANMKKTATYMATNKDFCLIPDEAVAQINKAIVQTSASRKKSCSGPPPQAQQQSAPGKPAIPRPPVELKLQ